MKILIATDGTRYGDAAIKAITKLRIGTGDAVRVVNVVEPSIPLAADMYGGYIPDVLPLEESARSAAERIISDALAKLASIVGSQVDVSSDILLGTPNARIVETAEEWEADLIILGSHGYKTWERLLLGSVSSSVVHHAPCSVMVVRLNENDQP
jgi:nucleotide-binding universal stress UspA family protein